MIKTRQCRKRLKASSFNCRPGLTRNINRLPFFCSEARPVENSFPFCWPCPIENHLSFAGPALWKNHLSFAGPTRPVVIFTSHLPAQPGLLEKTPLICQLCPLEKSPFICQVGYGLWARARPVQTCTLTNKVKQRFFLIIICAKLCLTILYFDSLFAEQHGPFAQI